MNRTRDLRIRSTVTLPTELRGRTEKVGDDCGEGGESRRREREEKEKEKRVHSYVPFFQDRLESV